MFTLLAKLAIGLSATVVATGFYHLAAAPPALAATDVCGPGNFSSACVRDNSLSPQSPVTEPDPQPQSPVIADPVPSQIVESPVIPDPVPPPVVEAPVIANPASPPVVESPVIADPAPLLPPVQPAPPPTFPDVYTNPPALRAATIPEPGTVLALLLTGAGIIYSGKKRNKQVGQQR